MTYEEEAQIAQQVLGQLAGRGASSDVRGAQVDLSGVGYSVHRHGADLRFNQKTNLGYREVGRFLIVEIGRHRGGWMVARATRPPGEYHDERAAEAARRLVERTLVQLGHDVGTPGVEGHKKTARELDADIQTFLDSPMPTEPIVRRPARRSPRRARPR